MTLEEIIIKTSKDLEVAADKAELAKNKKKLLKSLK
jgi:hypothetical protein